MTIKGFENKEYKKIIIGKNTIQNYIEKHINDNDLTLCAAEIISLFIPSYSNILKEELSSEELSLLKPLLTNIENKEETYKNDYIKKLYKISKQKKFNESITSLIITPYAKYLNETILKKDKIKIDELNK